VHLRIDKFAKVLVMHVTKNTLALAHKRKYQYAEKTVLSAANITGDVNWIWAFTLVDKDALKMLKVQKKAATWTEQ